MAEFWAATSASLRDWEKSRNVGRVHDLAEDAVAVEER
jgi:hypothetical protein